MTLIAGQKAPLYAQAKIARAGATRSGYTNGAAYITIAGVHVGYGRASPAVGVIIDSLTITDVLNETPNTCTFRVNGSVPAVGAEVKVLLGSKNRVDPLFAGFALTVTQRYAADNPRNVQADVAAVDYTWLCGFVKVTAQYRNQSASAIATDLVARFGAANGLTANNVAAGLPVLNEITFTNEDLPDALSRLADRIGAYWYVDYLKDIHFFFDEVVNGIPVDLTPTHKSLAHVTRESSDTQALTRVYVEGRGSKILAALAPGQTVIPVEAVDMFDAAPDVFAKVSFQGADGGAQHVTFSGVVRGAGGSIVGPGVTPSNAPTAANAAGTGIESGTHQYAYTWVTAAGETRPSPIASVSHGPVAAPPQAFAYNATGSYLNSNEFAGWDVGDTVEWALSYAGDDWVANATARGPSFSVVAVANSDSPPSWYNSPSHPSPRAMYVRVFYSSDPRVTTVIVWYRINGGSWLALRQGNTPGGTYFDAYVSSPNNSAVSGVVPTGLNFNRTQLDGVAVGPSSTTSRKIYRTVAAGSQLKLLATLADNTTTSYVDALADATLGANAPANDTSGLTQPVGQINAGATSIIMTSAAAFLAGGGYAVIGNGEQVIRYTGLSGNTLTGIPTSGNGSITAPITYGASVTAANLLTGIPASGAGAIVLAITPGDEIYFVVQADSGSQQAALAALGAGTGIREEWIQDRRLSIVEARARAQATLSLRPLNIQTVRYTSRDLLTASGKKITASLPAPTNITGTYRIQSVTINNFRPHPNQLPTFTAQASSVLFRFEDFLRMIRPEH